jgi:hypothetical protein
VTAQQAQHSRGGPTSGGGYSRGGGGSTLGTRLSSGSNTNAAAAMLPRASSDDSPSTPAPGMHHAATAAAADAAGRPGQQDEVVLSPALVTAFSHALAQAALQAPPDPWQLQKALLPLLLQAAPSQPTSGSVPTSSASLLTALVKMHDNGGLAQQAALFQDEQLRALATDGRLAQVMTLLFSPLAERQGQEDGPQEAGAAGESSAGVAAPTGQTMLVDAFRDASTSPQLLQMLEQEQTRLMADPHARQQATAVLATTGWEPAPAAQAGCEADGPPESAFMSAVDLAAKALGGGPHRVEPGSHRHPHSAHSRDVSAGRGAGLSRVSATHTPGPSIWRGSSTLSQGGAPSGPGTVAGSVGLDSRTSLASLGSINLGPQLPPGGDAAAGAGSAAGSRPGPAGGAPRAAEVAGRSRPGTSGGAGGPSSGECTPDAKGSRLAVLIVVTHLCFTQLCQPPAPPSLGLLMTTFPLCCTHLQLPLRSHQQRL